MKHEIIHGLPLLQSEQFLKYDWLHHGFSTRTKTPPPDPSIPFHLTYHPSRSRDLVRKNRYAFCNALEMPPTRLTTLHQILGATVISVTPENAGAQPLTRADGMVTECPGIPLMTFSADCVLILLVDPKQRKIASLHASWRGTLGQIARAGVTLMGSDPKQIEAVIGPSAGPCCYEIRNDCSRHFKSYPEHLHYRNHKTFLDLWGLNRNQLLDAGLTEDHIEVAGICTICRTDLFFSYRAEGPETGRFGGLIGMIA